MGREVRKVPPGWQHPTGWVRDYRTGKLDLLFEPLFEGNWSERVAAWDEGNAQWARGLKKSYTKYPDFEWHPRDADETCSFEEWDGPRPKQEDYMPEWSPQEATHLMMYETTSEGTPISPAFASPEELARWLADNGASSFGEMTATYEEWLPICRGGWAPSMVHDEHGLRSGVEALASLTKLQED